VNSSVTDRIFKVRMSLAWSKQKSTAQTSSGRLARNRSAGTAETPMSARCPDG